MSKKDKVARKRINYIMRKIKEMCEYNAYNRARTSQKTNFTSRKTQILPLKKNISARENKYTNI